MHEMSPDYYFSLDSFAHRTLFAKNEPVWSALNQIAPYLDGFSLGQIKGEVSEGAYLVNPELISIGEGTVVEPGAYVKGPCVIGRDCVVRHGAYIRGGVITGDRVVIGHTTEVKNSIFFDGAQAAHFAYVGDSILGPGVNLGAGTKLANLKLDGKNIQLRLNGERIDSGRRKFGAILGERVQLGCNSVTNPGSLMGRNSGCYPCTTVSGFVPSGTIIRAGRSHAAQ